MKNIFLGLFIFQAIFLSLIVCDEEEIVNIVFKKPKLPDNAYFADTIQPDSIGKKWILSQAKKDGISNEISKYDGEWSIEVPSTSAVKNDHALILKSKARHHAISAKLDRPIKFDQNELVVQYEVKFQNGMECGGAYIKLLSSSKDSNLSKFYDKTPFTIMFGPDKCGLESKVHFIIRHKNPLTNEYEEKFVEANKKDIADVYTNKKTHLFTLVLRKDNSFEIYIDQHLTISGDLLFDMNPAINPPNEIDDPNDKKPENWDDREKIPDATAVKPEDWDDDAPEYITDDKAEKPIGWIENEPDMINDPDAKKPEDWDASIDGEWEPPKIPNPVCKDADGCGEWKAPRIHNPQFKGVWSPPMINNPNYKGIWTPRKVPNPNYFEDKEPFKNLQPIDAIGLELWSMTESVAFDNFLIVDSKSEADAFAEETWKIKRDAEEKVDPSAQSIVDYLREVFSDKPWLIVIVVLSVILVIGLLFYCLCRGGSEDDDEEEPLLIDSKGDEKTDSQYSPAGAALSKKNIPTKSKDSDAESDVDYDENDDNDDNKSPKEVVSDIEDEEDLQDMNKEAEDKVRKRRARKD